MTSPTTTDLSLLAPADLLARLAALVAHSHELTATVLAHIAAVDARRLYLDAACPSMFVYLTTRLHCSEAVAYKHLGAARAARAFPVILDLVARGELHLCAVLLLAPHLTAANHAELLAQAVHRSKRDVEELVAARFPAPDAPPRLRKLPGPRAPSPTRLVPPGPGPAAAPLPPSAPATPPPVAAAPAPLTARPPAPAAPAVVAPLAADRYKVQLTVGRATRDKLTAAQDLLRHRVPDGDLAQVLDRALDALLRDLRRERFAASPRPRASTPAATPDGGSASRHIPAAIRRAVVARDGEQCTFVDDTGQRCPARGRLEFHHCEPFAVAGRHDADQIMLRCHGHNAHAARRDFGAAHLERRIAATRGPRVLPRGELPTAPSAGPS